MTAALLSWLKDKQKLGSTQGNNNNVVDFSSVFYGDFFCQLWFGSSLHGQVVQDANL